MMPDDPTISNTSVFQGTERRHVYTATTITLAEGAPRKLAAGDPDSWLWKVVDSKEREVKWVYSYDADAQLMITYAFDGDGHLAFDARTGEPVLFAHPGSFRVVVNPDAEVE